MMAMFVRVPRSKVRILETTNLEFRQKSAERLEQWKEN